jgi:hypothetical protein
MPRYVKTGVCSICRAKNGTSRNRTCVDCKRIKACLVVSELHHPYMDRWDDHLELLTVMAELQLPLSYKVG